LQLLPIMDNRSSEMIREKLLSSEDLIRLTARLRKKSGKSLAEIAKTLGVSRTVIFHAEKSPEKSLLQVRRRIIRLLSGSELEGPFYLLRRRGRSKES
jgi:DNA-binding XRE family transcriptional regulator